MEGGGFIIEPDEPQDHPKTNTWQSDLVGHHPNQNHYVPSNNNSGCSKCTSLSFSSEFHKAFGVLLCNQCRRNEKLISKSTAKQKYQVTDNDLKKLGSIKKTNPHKKNWQPMNLYLESQVRDIAYERHGDEQGIEEHARSVLDKKLQARLKKRELDKQQSEKHVERLQKIKKEITDHHDVSKAHIDGDDVEEI